MNYSVLNQAWADLTAPGQPFELVDQPVNGTIVRNYKNTPRNVRDLWLSTTQYADREYLIYRDERITYRQAHAQVESIAAWLSQLGVAPGDRVAIGMRNYPEWLLVYWACLSSGVTVVGLNAWWTASELDYVLKDSAPKVVFCDPERLERLFTIAGTKDSFHIVVTRTTAPSGISAWQDVLNQPGCLPQITIDPDADACIFYTSGTTGQPKGAQLTHRGCVANLYNVKFAAQVQALALQRMGRTPSLAFGPAIIPTTLITTPLFHVTANNCGAYPVTSAGGKLVLMYRWDAGEALRLIAKEGVTSMSGVPVMSREVLAHRDFDKTDTSSLISVGGGGAQLQPDLVAKIDAQVKTARPQTGYGMTETTGLITSIAADFFVDKPASVGRAMPTFEIRCTDEDGLPVPQGDAGEICVKGATIIKGYLNRPEATAEVIRDGWLQTGDIGRIDADGFVFIVDRKKDMVLRGGENIYCAEIEARLYQHEAIAECCVFGVPDDRLGEEVAAAIVLRANRMVSADALRDHCGATLAAHKLPRYFWFLIEPLPRNANGKFLKRQLRETLTFETAQ